MLAYINIGSVSFWSGAALLALGVTELIGGSTDQGVAHIVQGLGMIGLRKAIG
jgi:hypothetical protein